MYIDKTKGAQIRSRIKWFEEGEKNTKFFLGLEKSRQTKKTITALKDDDGNIHEDPETILQLCRQYYQNLYSSTNPKLEDIKDYIKETKIHKKLSNEDSEALEGKLTIKECTSAIFNMKLNKSPGFDGLSVEFYRTFWEELKEFAVTVFNKCYEKGELTELQKIGVISLLYKKMTL